MADSQEAPSNDSFPNVYTKNSPRSASPSPDAIDADSKLSRKREREVSIEPVTTPKSLVDSDPFSRELKDTRTPAKKNRRRLDTTEEEDDLPRSRSISRSPPISVSPPREMKIKVRQISQGVEDLSWRNIKANEPGPIRVGPNTNNGQDNFESAAPQSVGLGIEEEDTPPRSPDDSQLSQSTNDLQNPGDSAANHSNGSTESPSMQQVESENGDKGLKRKFLERGTSQGPTELGDDVVSQKANEPLKRPRDDADLDDNPRESKRPSPPPEPRSPPRPSPPSPKVQKTSGFMAYASSSSPFAAVKGPNLFSSTKSTLSPPYFSPVQAPSTPISALTAKLGESSTSTPTAAKRSGFEAFSGSSSPFASAARSKSPLLGSTSSLNRNKSPPRRTNSASSNPFASYAEGVQTFAVPVQKRARAGSPDGSSRSSLERNSTLSGFGSYNGVDSGTEDDRDEATSFGERLRAGKDDEDEETRSEDDQSRVVLTEQDVMTGEEEEETLHQVRGKLFSLDGNQWKERGTGLLKLNVKQHDGSGARLVMRKEAVYTLLLNVTLFHGMQCGLSQDPRYLRFSVIEGGITTHYNLRVANAKIAQELLGEIVANIPTA